MPRVLHADIELFLTTFLRREVLDPALVAKYPQLAGFEFTNREPDEDSSTFPAKLVVVRLDSIDWTSLTTADATLGVSVLMGSVTSAYDSGVAARVIHAITRDCARVEVGNPVAAVTESNGPYAVPEDQPRARWYSTHTLSVVGQEL